jgi:hypothetical protein
MERNQVIETIGSITKVEHLTNVQIRGVKNSMVLKSVNPFPGITNQKSSISKNPGSLFIILRYRYAPEKINRINRSLLAEQNLITYPSYGEVSIGSNILPCVRVKNLESYEQILPIQKFLLSNDLQLMPYRDIDDECTIKIFKTFRLAEIGDGLYRDLNDSEKFYIKIERSINWKRFEYVIKKIKFNIEIPDFDAALGVIYRFMGPQDVIRIFDKDKSYQRAIELRKHFLKEVKDEIHLSASHS